MRWVERVERRVVAVASLLIAVAASLPTASAGQAGATALAAAALSPARGAAASGAVSGTMSRGVADAVAGGVSGPVGGEALSAVGQLLADDATCTAAVVASSSGRLAVTAAHCVYVPAVTERMPDVAAGREPGWVDEVVFIPARSGDDAPHGTWAVERLWVDRACQAEATPEVDVAFLQLRDAPSGTAQEVLGALGVRFDGARDDGPAASGESGAGPVVDVLGYPSVAPFDGTRLRRCDQAATDAAMSGLLEARCALTRGASGGPWVVPDRGWWSAVAVSSYLSWDRPGALGGARLGASAEPLWRAADQAARR
ncbi:trypsin-like serine peptidase [Pseudonocardia saturnea]